MCISSYKSLRPLSILLAYSTSWFNARVFLNLHSTQSINSFIMHRWWPMITTQVQQVKTILRVWNYMHLIIIVAVNAISKSLAQVVSKGCYIIISILVIIIITVPISVLQSCRSPVKIEAILMLRYENKAISEYSNKFVTSYLLALNEAPIGQYVLLTKCEFYNYWSLYSYVDN